MGIARPTAIGHFAPPAGTLNLLFEEDRVKYVFSGSFAILALLSVVAFYWQPSPPPDRLVLTWVADPAPIRQEQAELFNRQNTKYRVVLDPNSAGDLFKTMQQCQAG